MTKTVLGKQETRGKDVLELNRERTRKRRKENKEQRQSRLNRNTEKMAKKRSKEMENGIESRQKARKT
jgi:hypothetical protein